MPEISALNQWNAYTSSTTKTEKNSFLESTGSIGSQAMTESLNITDFYQLLATQLQYQDADNPMDTAEMMSQLVQTQMSQSISLMTTAVNDLTIVNMYSYASSMMGQKVTVAEVDKDGVYTGEETTGTVTGVTLGSTPYITIDGKQYSIMQVMAIGDAPSSVEDDESADGSTDGSENTENTRRV